jgi:hypothetical protein
MKKENWLDSCREKYKQQIFVVTKITYLLWTASLAGALDKLKVDVLNRLGETLFVYVLFWIFLAGVGLLFSLFWNARNLKDFELILEGLNGGFLIPLGLAYVALLFSLSLISTNHDLAGTIIFMAIPISVGLWMASGAAIKKSGLIEYLKNAFIIR